ncbi:interferon-induced protein 44-like [Haliotis cracherodii]|uniref:interferon-induced protein 44-like n=1 Tax=Haliotis cracherodii TaxID=6455 RepID=UPI0039EB20B5
MLYVTVTKRFPALPGLPDPAKASTPEKTARMGTVNKTIPDASRSDESGIKRKNTNLKVVLRLPSMPLNMVTLELQNILVMLDVSLGESAVRVMKKVYASAKSADRIAEVTKLAQETYSPIVVGRVGQTYELKSEPEKNSPPGNQVDILLPWRKLPEVKQKVLKSELEKYAPPGKLNHVNILLLGTVGAGKTSYFNTINSIFKGRITSVARSGSAEHSLTTTYRLYRVKSAETGQPLKVRLCDTRGLEDVRNLDLTDLMVIIDGHLPDRFTFNPSVPVRPGVPGYKKNPTLDDRIHCIAFVVDSTAIDVFPDKVLQTFKAVQHRVNVQGLPQVVLLTKVDKACKVVNKDMSQLFLSAAIRGLVEKTAELFGLPRSHVYPVKNYEDELVLDDNVTLPALTSLVQMTRFADDFLNDCQDLDDD